MTDWLGFPQHFEPPRSHAIVPRSAGPVPPMLGPLMGSEGDQVAREPTDVALWYDERGLCLEARCSTADLSRVLDLVSRKSSYSRDTWGDDAFEVQIDVGLTRCEYAHFVLPPTGVAVTYRGFNNRHVQGWHPDFGFRVSLLEDEWTVEATFPFAGLGASPKEGDTWGLNLMRVNKAEPGGYVQWAPTFGDALRPELFGTITFGGRLEPQDLAALPLRAAEQRSGEVEAYARYTAGRQSHFLSHINGIADREVLDSLQVADWEAWSGHVSEREAPLPLRWDATKPGAEGIPPLDRPIALSAADSLVQEIEAWSLDPPESAAFAVEKLEALGDAYLLSREGRYVRTFERAVRIHDRVMRQKLAAATVAQNWSSADSPYHDYQIIRAAMLAYVYLSMRETGLSPETHSTVMRTMLRAGRFAAFNISTAHNYGNHQVYESSGLAIIALLFPEFTESDDWARIASRAIRLHLEHEVYADGAYLERCGYHSVAMNFAMQAVASIGANSAEARFPELMALTTLDTLERMHEWVLHMTAPDGALPAFGDYGAYSQLRILQRGAEFFGRPELTGARPLSRQSVSMGDSGFTVLRDGRDRDSFFMAVDHGPLGGQHSHVDNMGFVAYAYGVPVALDSGIGTSYSDPHYRTRFREARAHSVVVVDDVEPEKVAERTLWRAGEHIDLLEMRSRGLEHALGILHDRRIMFIRGLGWLIHDRLHGPGPGPAASHQVDWLLHTPFDLQPMGPGVLHGASDECGLLVLAASPEELEAPRLELKPASVPQPHVATMRQIDAFRRFGEECVRDITCLTWRRRPTAWPVEFVVFLLPYRGDMPQAQFTPSGSGWDLQVDDGRVYVIQNRGAEGGATVWQEEVVGDSP